MNNKTCQTCACYWRRTESGGWCTYKVADVLSDNACDHHRSIDANTPDYLKMDKRAQRSLDLKNQRLAYGGGCGTVLACITMAIAALVVVLV